MLHVRLAHMFETISSAIRANLARISAGSASTSAPTVSFRVPTVHLICQYTKNDIITATYMSARLSV